MSTRTSNLYRRDVACLQTRLGDPPIPHDWSLGRRITNTADKSSGDLAIARSELGCFARGPPVHLNNSFAADRVVIC